MFHLFMFLSIFKDRNEGVLESPFVKEVKWSNRDLDISHRLVCNPHCSVLIDSCFYFLPHLYSWSHFCYLSPKIPLLTFWFLSALAPFVLHLPTPFRQFCFSPWPWICWTAWWHIFVHLSFVWVCFFFIFKGEKTRFSSKNGDRFGGRVAVIYASVHGLCFNYGRQLGS